MRQPRGFNGSATHLIAPPLPAASRPSNRTTSFLPVALIQYCIFTSSMCSSSGLASYVLRFSLRSGGDLSQASTSSAALLFFLPTVSSLTLHDLVEKLPVAPPWPFAATRSMLPSSPLPQESLVDGPAASSSCAWFALPPFLHRLCLPLEQLQPAQRQRIR